MLDTSRAVPILSGLVLLAALGLPISSAHADTLVNTSGTSSGLFNNNPEGVSWTLSGSYTGVSISALVSSGSVSQTGAGTFYLTNSIGSATTAANVIAETTLSGLAYEPTSDTTLFSGLSLAPGTYYLISSSDLGMGGLVWEGLSTPVTTTGSGAAFNGELFSFDSAAFAPSDNFSPLVGPTFGVDVTGTPAAAVAPEPASLALLGTGLLGLLGAAKRRFA